MGGRDNGQLGPNYAYDRTPFQIAVDVTGIAAGTYHSLFFKTDGTLWSMGSNYTGQLGNGSLSYSSYTPTQVATGVARVAAGSAHSFFIKTDGSLWGMGSNYFGQLGLGSLDYTSTPVRISKGARDVVAGIRHSLILSEAAHGVTFDLRAFGRRIGGGLLVQRVYDGASALAPEIEVTADRIFYGWDAGFEAISGDLVIHARYLRVQSIDFPPPTAPVFDPAGTNTLTLVATASSGLSVAFEVVSGPAILQENGRTLTLTDAGFVVLRASQPGDDAWTAAAHVELRLAVGGRGQAQEITFSTPVPRTYGDPAFPLVASASSGLPVAFELVSGPASVEGNTLTFTDVGRIVIRASQPGGAGFGAAPDVTRILVVNKAPLTVSVADASRFVGEPDPAFALLYSGFAGSDAADEPTAIAALNRLPVARSKATLRSGPGDYAVILSGGSDNHYKFRFANPAGTLTVLGFGGTYEALLLDQDNSGTPIGKLTLTIPANRLSYTGVLNLAREAGPVAVSSTSKIEGTTPLVPDPEFVAASATWNRVDTGFDSLAFTVNADGTLTGSYRRNSELLGILAYGRRLYFPAPRTRSPWSGRHTLVLGPGFDVQTGSPVQIGSGHASATIASASGVLSLSGKLADGAPFTANIRPSDIGTYLLWTNPYGLRTHSFLAGLIADDSVDANGSTGGQEANTSFLVWQKAALPASTPPRKRDKSCRAGIDLILSVSLDRWLPPVRKASTGQPAKTLPQRLGVASTNVAFGDIDVSHTILDETGYPLPLVATLTTASKLLVGTPNDTKWRVSSLNPATGAFSGSFILTDSTPTDANPDKTTKRTVPFSGTLRQRNAEDPDDDLVGTGFFLLPALPGAESNEQISGELRFTVPAP